MAHGDTTNVPVLAGTMRSTGPVAAGRRRLVQIIERGPDGLTAPTLRGCGRCPTDASSVVDDAALAAFSAVMALLILATSVNLASPPGSPWPGSRATPPSTPLKRRRCRDRNQR